MTPELSALLQRIQTAGGPAKQHGPSHWEGDMGEDAAPYGFTCCPEGHWCEADTALMIHTLKLDALARGVRSRTAHEPGRHRVWLYDEPGDQVGAAEHESEATAWCLAWLTAFEQEEAA